ncbi:peptidylprolyl isomerase [Aeromicrobium sp.]|uniref:peptidylprolyl isomerase n=1 Tax=Aeromicrobium sp. TaxID=1871063 RepID=UPI003517F25F
MRLRRTAALLALTASVALSGCGGDDSSGSKDDADGAASTGGCDWVRGGEAAKKVDPPAADAKPATSVVLTINGAEVPIELNTKAPCAATSFTSLAEQGYYDDAPCSRVSDPAQVPYGILQCGDPTGTGSGGPGYSFADELTGDESCPAGSVAMANAGPDTNGSQFFLNFADSQFPPDYTLLGTMSPEGMTALKKVVSVGAEGGVGDGAPAEPVTIESARPVE